MDVFSILSVFALGFLLGVICMVLYALMAASSEDSRRREKEDERNSDE